MHSMEQRHWLRNGLYVALLFLLLKEWLLPITEISEVTQIYRIEPFLVAMFLFLMLQYVRCSLTLSVVFNVVISLGLTAYYFQYGSVLEAMWWEQLFGTVAGDLQYMLDQQWHRLSGELRTFMFLFGWSLLIYAIYVLLVERHSVRWFVGATLAYLLFLQYVWGLDTSSGIWRTVVIGGVLLTISRSARLAAKSSGTLRTKRRAVAYQREIVTFSKGSWKATLIGICLFVCAGGGAAWLSADATEPRPIVLSFAGQSVSKTGYGDDDAKLGNSLQQDHQVAFTAYTEQLTYWKGETKSFYDGSGWSEPRSNEVNVSELLDLSAHSMEDQWIPVKQEVFIEQASLGSAILFRGGSRVTIHDVQSEQHGSLGLENVFYDDLADRYMLAPGVRATSYRMTTYLPRWIDGSFESDAWRAEPEVGSESESVASFAVGDQYLQLPSALPERVRELAREIAGELDDPFEIAQAIEQYLRNHYSYTLEQTNPPVAGQDFVDHFLFEQQQGYCDHFSTSMVILLRAQGIPAKWVKGFTPGEVVGERADGQGVEVVVRNSDAHSWVEAYIPEFGWLPFEPTPAFSADGLLQSLDESAMPAMSSLDDGAMGNTNQADDRLSSRLLQSVQSPHVWIRGLVAVAIIFMFAFLWDVFRRLRLLLALVRLRFCTTSEAAVRTLALLWQRWFELYGKKANDQTLREYVSQLKPKSEEQQVAMNAFLEATEQLQYGETMPVKLLRKQLGANWRKGCE